MRHMHAVVYCRIAIDSNFQNNSRWQICNVPRIIAYAVAVAGYDLITLRTPIGPRRRPPNTITTPLDNNKSYL